MLAVSQVTDLHWGGTSVTLTVGTPVHTEPESLLGLGNALPLQPSAMGLFRGSQGSGPHPGVLTDSLLGDLTRLSSSASQKGPRSDSSKSNKIFVGGIPHNCGETELREYFKKFGVVSPGPAPLGGPRAAPCFPEAPGMAGGRAGREWDWDWGLACRHHPGASPSLLVVACFWGVAFSFRVS